ncbi:nitroreductase family protein [Curtobacterium sp. NPDC087080]|uniref:nitroreductase family protein n=1 Tax=Curtobacterium sp. NPDC087080 TaxID=3363965 RepID=UPI00381CE221
MTDRISIVSDLRTAADASAQRVGSPPQQVSAVPGSQELGRAMRYRSATTQFVDQPVERRHVDASAAAMTTMDAGLWGDAAHSSPLRVLVACRRVVGVQPGLYEYVDGGLLRLDGDAEPLRMREMVLQPEFAEAGAILLAVGNLAGMTSRFGAHGHRMLLSRGGAACEAAWLTAVEFGLVGSIFAGFLPGALRQRTGIDGSSDLQLLALAIGAAA